MIEKLIALILDLQLAALRELHAPTWLIDGLVEVTQRLAPVLTRMAREQIAGGALPELKVPREPGDWRIVEEEIARAMARADTVPPAPPTERTTDD